MKQDKLIFRMAARCEAAGRPNNEDNYQLDSNLADDQWGFTADEQVELGEKGALLVVCDGMGGMNAGEVASDIAVRTIKEWFSAEKLTAEVLASPMKYIKYAIIAADAAIKKHGKEHPETDGMGSTCVMAWMLGKKVYVGWCGDSRCYCYNPKNGLVRLSHDHSYVQELVDAGKLTEELAFDHPNNNIITRSLGDPSGAARPDVKEFALHNEDIIMLCSDGLCGCLRDNEIEEQIAAHQTSMQECRDALWAADEAAGWHDNVTIGIAQVVSGGVAIATASGTGAQPTLGGLTNSQANKLIASSRKMKFIALGSLLCLLLVVGGVGCYLLKDKLFHKVEPEVEQTDGNEEGDVVETTEEELDVFEEKQAEGNDATSKESATKEEPKAEKEAIKASMKGLSSQETVPQVKKAEPAKETNIGEKSEEVATVVDKKEDAKVEEPETPKASEEVAVETEKKTSTTPNPDVLSGTAKDKTNDSPQQ